MKPKRITPKIAVHLTRRPGASRTPGAKDFEAAFLRAWKSIPRTRFPEAFEQKRLRVNLLLIGDKEIAELNAQHMNHDGPTDVLSFPMGEFDLEAQAFHIGDVIVSYETAARESAARKIPLREELLRYALHGFLHCMGCDDTTPAKRKAMFAVQEQALRQ